MIHIAKLSKIAPLARWAARPLRDAISTLEWMSRVASQRHALRLLDDRQLKDIGLTRAEAIREANRSFWDVPRRSRVEGSGAVCRPRSQGHLSSPGGGGATLPPAALPSG